MSRAFERMPIARNTGTEGRSGEPRDGRRPVDQDNSYDAVVERLWAGDPDAADWLFHHFAGRLIGLAYRRLDRHLRPKMDAEDVVQSVFKSFFGRLQTGHFEAADWDGLWGLLVIITLRKCGKKLRHFGGPAHDVRREVALPDDGEEHPDWKAIAREPTPEEAAVLAETVAQVLGALTEGERPILELRLQGFTAPEIGERLGRSEHTVNWVLKRVRKRLQHLQDSQ